ncbi:MAG: acetate--CoA ligase family protein, partial [Anaerovoracaceae bacterium]
GADKVYDALFKKFGVIRVYDLEELMSTAQAFAVLKKLPQSEGVSTISLSGGETGICADQGEKTGIIFPDFEKETLDKLNEMLPSYATPNNPLDSTASLSYNIEKFAGVCKAVMEDKNVGIVGIGYTLLQEIADNAIYYMSEALEIVMKEPWAKPCVMIPFAENTRNKEYVEKLETMGVPVLPTSGYSFKIIKNIVDFSNYKIEDHNLDMVMPNKELQSAENCDSSIACTETESKDIISKIGIDCGKYKVATTKEEAKEIFKDFGQKVVAKVDSRDILHKSDVGCVILNIDTEDAAEEAFERIVHNAKSNCPTASIDGVQICQQAKMGTEMILGISNDPSFGPCVLVGLGGIFVEIFKDTALSLAPISREEARKMLTSLKGYKMLDGYRGKENCDIDAMINAIVNVSEMAKDKVNEIKELDINPIFLYEKGLC